MLLTVTINTSGLAMAILSTLIVAIILLLLLFGVFLIIKQKLPWRKVALYGSLLLFVSCYPFAQPFVHLVADMVYGAAPTTDALGNISGAQVAADQVAGGAVPVGTVYTKLWITALFYLLFCSLPWFLQRATHPGPTEWAKVDYTRDFKFGLNVQQKFEAYQRLQLVQAMKIVGAGILAALIV
jgi:hypothetical protein